MHLPFQQGDLDGLCAIYACINATKLITGKMNHERAQNLFLRSVTALANKKESIAYITDGTNSNDIVCILRDIICPEFNILRSKPFHKRSQVSIDEFWKAINNYLKCNQRSKNQQKQRIKTLINSAAQTSAYQEFPTADFLRPIPEIF